MAMNIKNERVERLAEELAQMTGESKTAAILRALEERRNRIANEPPVDRRIAQVLDFMEKEIWANVPQHLLGQPVSKQERERILGYGRSGL